MIDEVPSIRLKAIHRPDPTLVAALHGTPTGFIVDALGGSGAWTFLGLGNKTGSLVT